MLRRGAQDAASTYDGLRGIAVNVFASARWYGSPEGRMKTYRLELAGEFPKRRRQALGFQAPCPQHV